MLLKATPSEGFRRTRAEVELQTALEPTKRKDQVQKKAVFKAPPVRKPRDPRTAALVVEIIENLKQSNQEELEICRKYELK